MKVLYIANATTPRGGANIVLINLVRELKKKAVELCIVCPDKNGIYEVFSKMGVKVVSIPFVPDITPNVDKTKDLFLYIPRLIKWGLINNRGYKALLKFAKIYKPDIIHSNSSVIGVGFYVANKLNIPHITHFREYGDLDFNLKVRNIKNRLRGKKNYSICITNGIASHHLVNNHSHNRVIYDGVIEENSIVTKSSKRGDYFFYAGRLTHLKGIEFLIDAYIKYVSKLSELPVKLLIAGRYDREYGLLHHAMLKKLEETGKTQYVEWLGEVDNTKVREYMKSAIATIVPSYFEGFGLVIPEATSQGSLTIGRNTAGTKEQFDNGVAHTGKEIGLRFNTESQLVEILMNIHKMPNGDIKAYVDRAQSTIREFYSIPVYGKRIFNFYKEILNQTRSNK